MVYRDQLARLVFEIGAFKDKTRSPGGKGFKLKLHQKNPDAPLSPFYMDFRILRSYPTALATAAKTFKEMLHGEISVLADVPTAATPIVAVLSQMTGIPMVTPRVAKDYGTQATIDGVWKDDDVAAVFDDLVTKADSKLEAIRILEAGNDQNGKLQVRDVYVLVDRMQGGGEELARAGYNLRAAHTIDWLLEFYRSQGMITEDLYKEIVEYRAAAA